MFVNTAKKIILCKLIFKEEIWPKLNFSNMSNGKIIKIVFFLTILSKFNKVKRVANVF